MVCALMRVSFSVGEYRERDIVETVFSCETETLCTRFRSIMVITGYAGFSARLAYNVYGL